MNTRVIVTDSRQIGLLEHLQKSAPEVEITPADQDRLREVIADADILLGRASREDLMEAKRLKWLHVNSAGVNYLPMDLMEEMGIQLTNGRGLHGDTIGDHVMAFVLAHSRDLFTFDEYKRRGLWKRQGSVRELAGLTMGIIGAGAIGKKVATRARAFDMKVLGTNRSGEPVEELDETHSFADMDRVLAVSDYLVVACPLTEETGGLIGARELAQLPPGAFVINIARGEIIDEGALVDALKSGNLGGAGLDVFTEEPLPEDSPLWTTPGVMITPHVAGRQSRAAERGAERFLHNLDRYIRGLPLDFRVDYRKGY